MARMPVTCFVALLTALLLAGCAGFTNKNITSAKDDEDASGFRYYETAPFLLVYTDGKGGLTSEVLYLPDFTKKRSIQPYAYAASNKATLKFDRGRLLQAKAVVDETVVPVSVIAALEKVAIAQVKASATQRKGGEKGAETVAEKDAIPAPYLFRIRKDEAGQWSLRGRQAVKADGTPSRVEYLP